jgi:hypothetical protein
MLVATSLFIPASSFVRAILDHPATSISHGGIGEPLPCSYDGAALVRPNAEPFNASYS